MVDEGYTEIESIIKEYVNINEIARIIESCAPDNSKEEVISKVLVNHKEMVKALVIQEFEFRLIMRLGIGEESYDGVE